MTVALRLVDTFPAASLAQAKRVLVPDVVKVYFEGADGLQPAAEALGAVADSVTR